MMSTKGAKKCTTFEPQLFRRSLCKNCFRTEAEHRQDSRAISSPEVADGEKKSELAAKSAAGPNEVDGRKTEIGHRDTDSKGKTSTGHDPDTAGHRSKVKGAKKVSENKEVKGQRTGTKSSDNLGSEQIEVETNRTEKDHCKDTVGSTISSTARERESTEHKDKSISVQHAKQPVSEGQEAYSGVQEEKTERRTTAGNTELEGESSKNVQHGGGKPASKAASKAAENSEHSSEYSQKVLRHTEAGKSLQDKTDTTPEEKQDAATGTVTGPGVSPTQLSRIEVLGSVCSIASGSSGIVPSPGGSTDAGIGAAPLEASGSKPGEHLEYSGRVSDIESGPSASYTAGLRYLENRNSAIREIENSTGASVQAGVTPANTDTGCVQQQQYDSGPKQSRTAVVPASSLPQLQVSDRLLGAGQGIPSGVDKDGRQATELTQGGTPEDTIQLIPVQHLDQSGSVGTSGSGSVSQAGASRPRTRRTRGNSDHLVQDPSTVTIQYPGNVSLSGQTAGKYGIANTDSETSERQAALIIIPSENRPTVTSQVEPYRQETQHVAYHKPIPDDTSGTSASKTVSDDTLRAISGSSLYYYPESDQRQHVIYSGGKPSADGWYYNSNVIPTRSQTDDDVTANGTGNRGAYFVRRRRKRPSVDESAWQAARQRRMADSSDMTLARDEAMMEGTRMLIDSLREKIVILEARTEKIDREKEALGNLLSTKKQEFTNMEDDLKFRIEELEDQVTRLTNEKIRLLDRLKLPESERSSLRVQETEINELQKKMEETNQRYAEILEENAQLRQECRDLQLEMDEMHDQFREDEALEFREIQKELEATAKNCRILQFKLRKSERRNDQLEADRIHYEEKIRQLEAHFDDKLHIREMEEELKMAKEVSVRLHDELEFVEEKRHRYEEELDRVNDILTESESRRHALQKEVDNLTTEMGKLREELRRTNAVGPVGGVKQGPAKEGDYDLAQLMRDLSDSLERENDLKEQLKFAEEETRITRKKLSDMEEENESLNLQLQKLSSAKSGKFLRKKDPGEKEIVTEREHELRLEMELAEQEIKVLRRKLDDLEEDNELLMKQMREIQNLIEGKDKRAANDDEEDDRPYDEKIREMARDIEALKLKLIAKDQEAASKLRNSAVRGMLKKSRSLEDYRETSPSMAPAHDFQQDVKRQLDFVQQEAGVLKEKLAVLEKDNERLVKENRKLEMMSGRSGVPAISVDDAVVENVGLRGRLVSVERENAELREQVRLLDDRTKALCHDVLQTKAIPDVWDESSESRGLRDQLHGVQDECKTLRKKVGELERQNDKLARELGKYKGESKKSREYRQLEKLSSDELKDRVYELEGEIKNLMTVIRTGEDETERLEEEIDGYRADIDKMLDAFRTREKELVEEIDNIQQRNEVLTNLLDLVTERADSTAKQLERFQKELTSQRTPANGVTAPSHVNAEGDDVTASEIRDKFQSRIESLEAMLQEERLKLQATEKKLSMKDSPVTSVADDSKLKEREKEILQQELALCQKQLKSANEQIRSLKERLTKEQEAYESYKEENEKLSKQIEAQKKADSSDLKKPASWRWEKQDLEKQIKELKKKLDDMHEELKRQQFKWKLAGDDLARENKLKEKLEKQLQNIRDESDAVKKELEQTQNKLNEVTKSLEKKEKQWAKEREALESDKMAAEQDAKDKTDVIRSKDDIIKNKDKLIKDKDRSLKERDEMLTKKDELIKQKEAEIEMKNNSIKHKDDEIKEVKTKCEAMETSMREKDGQLKKLDEDIRRRDDRLKEKDEILEKINRKLVEKQNEISDMDKTLRESLSKLDEREVELMKMRGAADNTKREMKTLEEKVKELRAELDKQRKEYERKLSAASKQKDKVESELSTLQKEKKALLNDLQDTKERLKREEDKWRREKNKLELELNQKTEKLRSLDASRGLRQSEVVKNLSSEKEKLITEKHRLADDMNRLKKELKDNVKQWNAERDDLQKIIAEKTKMIEDNNAITERMQKEIDALKIGQTAPSTERKAVPIPVKHEMSSRRIPVIHQTAEEKNLETELKAKLEEQEILMEADKESLKELYEGRIENLTEALSVAQDKVSSLKEENDKQLELLQSSRKALSELRNRYDQRLNTWNEEKERLEKKANEAEERKEKIYDLQKTLDDTKEKLKMATRKIEESEKRLTAEKKTWAAEKANLQSKLKQYEESPPSVGSAAPVRRDSKVSEFRAKFDKFEKFGGMQGGATGLKKAGAPSTGAAGDFRSSDVDKTVKEAQKAIKELQTLMKEVESSRESDKKELFSKLDKERKEWEKERAELKQRTKKLETRSKDFSDQEKAFVELQCKLQDERAIWQTEKKQLQQTLDETKAIQLKEKEKVSELLAEIKRLKSLTKSIHDKEADDSATEAKVRTPRRSRTPSEERPSFTTVKILGSEQPEQVKNTLDKSLCEIITKALEHISKLAEELKNPVLVSERKKVLTPSIFRRSLSISEMELKPDSLVSSHKSDLLHPPSSISVTDPHLITSLDRSRRARRSMLPEGGAPESDVVDRRSFRSSSNRNSMYASGTQSAYTSRESSPERGHWRSPYPAAPPSMIITPSHTPRRAPSAEREGRSFTSRDMAALYAKLSTIDSAETASERREALARERGRRPRILTKSTSLDHTDDQTAEVTSRLTSRYTRAADWSSSRDGYSDAEKSETLLASIRLGQLVITPGVEKVAKSSRSEKRSTSLSPRSARRKFYESYPYDTKDTDHWARRLRHHDGSDVSGGELDSDTDRDEKRAEVTKRRSLSRGLSVDSELAAVTDVGADVRADVRADDGDVDAPRSRKEIYSLRSRAANFIQNVKNKRRMFSKRSRSVDTSVRKSIATSGLQAGSTAAPSVCEPPIEYHERHLKGVKDSKGTTQSKSVKEDKGIKDSKGTTQYKTVREDKGIKESKSTTQSKSVKEDKGVKEDKSVKEEKSVKEGRRKVFTKRSSSIDLTTFFSTSRSSSVKEKSQLPASSAGGAVSSHSASPPGASEEKRSPEEGGAKWRRSTPALPAKKAAKKQQSDA